MIAALPMYDWPEVRGDTDRFWASIRDVLRGAGIDAPETLTRGTGDLYAFWRRPDLFFAQTCWGPLGDGLADHVHVIGQPDYSDVEGGEGALYRSAVLMREGDAVPPDVRIADWRDRIEGKRFAYNQPDSMSGYLALEADLGSLSGFGEKILTGGHRASIRAVADGRADFCTVDCRSWAMARIYEPAADGLVPIGWTTARRGLPYITSRESSPERVAAMREVLLHAQLIVS